MPSAFRIIASAFRYMASEFRIIASAFRYMASAFYVIASTQILVVSSLNLMFSVSKEVQPTTLVWQHCIGKSFSIKVFFKSKFSLYL